MHRETCRIAGGVVHPNDDALVETSRALPIVTGTPYLLCLQRVDVEARPLQELTGARHG